MVIFLFIVFITIIFIFSSKKLSPIPYFPSQKIDLPLIVKALDLKNNQTVFDLGAGDGVVIFKAAQSSFNNKLNTKFIAVEINPILILILYLRRLFHPNRKNIKIVRDDIFKMNFNITMKQWNNVIIYLYISPWFLKKVIENCLSAEALTKVEKLKFVSYMYPIKSLKNKQEIIQGKNKIFVYN